MIFLKACVGAGNRKVGRIPTFSLPSRLTCPGASTWCIQHCYARRFERLRTLCRLGYSRNLVLTWDTERFVSTMLAQIPPDLSCFRIHVSGDYYDAPYCQAWQRICLARPCVRFYAYTLCRDASNVKVSSFLTTLRHFLRAHPNITFPFQFALICKAG